MEKPNRSARYDAQDFNRLYKELDDLYHDAALKMGISDSELTILYAVSRLGGGCLQRDICEQACISKQTVNTAVRKLEREGLLCLGTQTNRNKQIHLTEAGMRFARENICPLVQMEDEAFWALRAEEQEELLRLTRKYVEGFRDRFKKGL